ncbi:MAG: type II toxin-antitoxin system VapC family toxin [Anaerolineales bacterium]|nr:type II toxin-antitoxin system VapC family toxin [Anaerolineales bacterium]
MKLLFDTHTFIWWDSDPSQLSQQVLELCHNPENTLILSIATVWEIQIKSQLGKLSLTLPLNEYVRTQQQANGFYILPIHLEHVFKLNELPLHHKDPFDRLLIAQSAIEDAVLLSKDRIFAAYPINVLW